MKKTIFITGATSGIGLAIAERLAETGARLIICGRRGAQLEAFKDKYKELDIKCLTFDVRKKGEIQQAIQSLDKPFNQIDVLINNAGNAFGLDAVEDADTNDWEAMLDTNVRGLFMVAKAVLPLMPKHQNSHIINMGSISGKEAYPKGSVYCASKAAVAQFNDVLRIELLSVGIKVSLVSPGAVHTLYRPKKSLQFFI